MKADEVSLEGAHPIGRKKPFFLELFCSSFIRQFFQYLTVAIMSKYKIRLKFLAATSHDYFILSFG